VERELEAACAMCGITPADRACRAPGGKGPAFCPTKNMDQVVSRAVSKYSNPQTHEFARQASVQEAECYINRDAKPRVRHPVKPRIQEIIEFAQKLGYERLGLAYCGGLQREGGAVHHLLEEHGFDVCSVMCKVGCTPKETIGISDEEKVSIGEYETMCNPIAQAEILNDSATEFNILMGLCVGHDSLFLMHSQAPTTVFAVKDRVLAHNPLGAIYTLGSYYERFKGKK